jgi:hypothetical protein
MFNGENCVRCNKHFKFEELIYRSTGWGMCRDCDAMVDPGKEAIRLCPHDGKEMRKEVIYYCILIDICPDCRGVWLDGHEIALIRRMVQLEGVNNLNLIPLFLLPLLGAA